MQLVKRSLYSGLLAIAAVAACSAGHAQSTGSYGTSGSSGNTGGSGGYGGYGFYGPGTGYVGLNVGQSNYSLGSGFNLFSANKHDVAYNIYTGSFANENFGLELGYTHFGKIGRAGGDTKAEGINLSLVGRAPISPQFNILGKLGTTYGRTDVSAAAGSGVTTGRETGFGVSYGLGAEYVFSNQLSGVLQYDEHRLRFAGEGRDRISATTVGLRYRF